MFRMSLLQATLAVSLLLEASAFSPSSAFLPRSSLPSSPLAVSAPLSPSPTSASSLSMAMTTPKPGKASKFAPLPVPGSNTPLKKSAAEKDQDDKAEWRMELPEPKIESECGADYIPLLTALKLGNYEEADQLTRDLLIWIGGEGTRQRGFVYFAEAPNLPRKDMETIDRLWVAYSKGKFGFSVQKDIWNSKNVQGDFSRFVSAIEWNVGPCGGCDKQCSGCPGTLKRWTAVGQGGNEYVYDLNKAKKGHLPLTSALRGTYLLKKLLSHKAFGDAPTLGEALVTAKGTRLYPSSGGGGGARYYVEPEVEEIRIPAAKVKMIENNYVKNKSPWDA